MDFKTAQELLPDYIRGLLSEKESRTIQEQLALSEPLRREYERLQSYFRALETLEPVKAPPTFARAVHTRIATPPLLSHIIKKIFTPLPVKLPIELAGLVATAAIVILIFNPFTSKNIPPVVFDESAIQAKKAPLDTRVVIEQKKEVAPEKVEETVTSVPQKKAAAQPKKKTVLLKKQRKPASTGSTLYAAREGHRAEAKKDIDKKKQLPAPRPAKKELAEEAPAEMEPLARAEPAPPAPAASAAGAALMDEDAQYVDNIIKSSRSIVNQTKIPQPSLDDVGLLALAISGEKRDQQEEQSLSAMKRMEAPRSRAREKRARKKKAEPDYYAAAESAPADAIAPTNEVTFAVIEKKIKSHNGTCSLMPDKPQTPDKKYYLIEIPRERFQALKEDLELEGTISDEKFSIETSQAKRIQFNLIVTIE